MDYGEVFHDVLVHVVVWILIMFYMYSGIIGSRDPGWLQGAMNVLIYLFRQIGLAMNGPKSKTIILQPGDINPGMYQEAFGWSSTGEGET